MQNTIIFSTTESVNKLSIEVCKTNKYVESKLQESGINIIINITRWAGQSPT